MNKTLSIAALAFCGLWGASIATATASYCSSVSGNLAANCGFESGDFTSWMLSGNTDPANTGNYYGVDNFDAQSGNFGAYLGQYTQNPVDGTAPLDLSQTIATLSGATYTVSFFLEQDNAPSVGETHTFSATFGSSTLLNLTPSVASPGPNGSFVQYTYSVAATSSSTLLNFVIRNDDSFWSLDDVVVAQVVTPEPSTFVLGAGALGGLLLMRRKIG